MMQDGNAAEAKKALKALIADVPYSNKKWRAWIWRSVTD